MASAEHARIVAMLRSMPRPEPGRISVKGIRRFLDVLATIAPPPPGTEIRPVTLPGGIRAEWVLAGKAQPDRRLLYLHGGAYLAGTPATYEGFASRLSTASGCSVLVLDYRLAPENPFPAAVEDSIEAYRWVVENGPNGPGSATRVFVAGDSAGGGLTLAVLVAGRDRRLRPPSAAVTFSAWTDLEGTGESLRTRSDVEVFLPPSGLGPAAALYLAGKSARDPLASPLYADLRGLPPLLMQVGDAEILLDDTLRVTRRAKEFGVDVATDVWPEMFHVFQVFAETLPEGRAAIDRVAAFLEGK